MCTVSFIPSGDKVIITSNRDEKIVRPAAIAPKRIHSEAGYVYYPVDAKAGGTWFIANERGEAGVLLNGAHERHQPKEKYGASRGAILLKLFATENVIESLESIDFELFENCTLVLYSNEQLMECIWDGTVLTIHQLNSMEPHIWSSVTLYNNEMIAERREWFTAFLTNKPEPNQEEMIHFHANTGRGNNEYGLKMNRANQMLTVSITSVELSANGAQMQYHDLMAHQQTSLSIAYSSSAVL